MSPRAAVTTPSPPQAVPLYAQPSDVTLVKDILAPWVTSGDTNAGAYVHAADLYSADPEALARRFRPAVSVDGDFTWYFLSPLRTKSPRDRRKVRAVADGTGCWHSEAAPKNVVDHLDGGRHVGYRQSFSFMRRGGGGEDVRAGWIMAEFHLHHEGLGMKVEGLVLCKMYRSPRKHDAAAVAPKHGAAVALKHGAAVAPNGDDDVCSGVSLSAETTTSCGMSKAVNDDAVTPRWQGKNSDGVEMAMAMTAPLLTKKAAGDDEVSGMTTAVAPCPKDKALAADDEDLVVSPPPYKKMRMAVVGAESSGAAMAPQATASSAPAAEAQLHCPQCGFHLAALQALVTLTKSRLIVPHGDAADAEITRR